ncbi:MAG: hypothetical protein L3J67_12080 [Hyphomicrobiaceae bacterium]|nr:hypothetical protein [Hyphomicrobiaceae bacterium]
MESVLHTRQQIIADSVAHSHELSELRSQIGSWKEELQEEIPENSRGLAAELAVDDAGQDLLKKLRRDIASYTEEEESEVDEEKDENLSLLRGELTGFFDKTPVDEPFVKKQRSASLPTASREASSLKDDLVGVNGLSKSVSTGRPSKAEKKERKERKAKAEKSLVAGRIERNVTQKSTNESERFVKMDQSSLLDQRAVLGLLGELKTDMSALKVQHDKPLVPEVNEILDLFVELKADMAALQEERNQPLVPEVNEILGLFAELKADMAALKEERAQPVVSDSGEMRELVADLKAEIEALKNENFKYVGTDNRELMAVVGELKNEVAELGQNNSEQNRQNDDVLLEMFSDLQDEFSRLRSQQASLIGQSSSADFDQLSNILGALKGDVETLKDEQMKAVEQAQNVQAGAFNGLLQDLKEDFYELREEQIKVQSGLQDEASRSDSPSERINHLLVELKEEVDTARLEDNDEDGGMDIDRLSAVNSVLTLLIGESSTKSHGASKEEKSKKAVG